MKRKRPSLPAFLISFSLVFGLLCQITPLSAYAVTQEEIDALRAQRDAITAKREEKQAVVEELQDEKAGVLEQKRALDERNTYTLMQINLNNEEIQLYDEMIAEKEKELLHAQELEQEQLERYRSRVRAMEENGTLNILALILKSNNLGEMLTAIDDIGEIMQNDRELEDAYIRARENTEEVKAEYLEYRSEVNAKQDELREEQKKLEDEIDEAAELLLEIQKNIDAHQAEFEEIMAEEDATEQALNRLVAQLEAERAAAEAARRAAELAKSGSSTSSGSSGTVGTGVFIFPVASYVYISSRFGERVHPITGELKHHNGMDIASNMGTTVYAADSGTVVLAEWYGGYGNCIMIDHGNGYKTLYGHLSYIGVSEGQSVTKGDNIGQVGSTGNSTGPHLHFEVYKNESRIDPEQFYSGLVISPDAGV